MAFLDNSGDIILDAVLTDAGRQRMARGEFKIVKFALGDEEVNYELFNSSHPSGSAFADLKIMQTPVLESFTNNTSLMKSKLLSINRNNILYMPIFQINQNAHGDGVQPNGRFVNTKFSGYDGFYVLADQHTVTVGNGAPDGLEAGVHSGMTGPAHSLYPDHPRYIAIDQGLETAGDPGRSVQMPDDLLETAFLIRMDHRLLRLYMYSGAGGEVGYTARANSFVDDDAIATYYVSSTDAGVVSPRTRDFADPGSDTATQAAPKEIFNGPLGTRLRLAPKTSIHVQQSAALFDELGSTASTNLTIRGVAITTNYKYIDTLINVVGVTTGYSIDIPIRIIKYTG